MQRPKTNSALPGKAGGTPGRETDAAHASRDPHVLTYPSASCPGHALEGPSGRGQGLSWLPGDVTFVTNSPLELNFSANGHAELPAPVTPLPLQGEKGAMVQLSPSGKSLPQGWGGVLSTERGWGEVLSEERGLDAP